MLKKLSGKSALVLAAGAMVLAVTGIANAGGGANNIKNGNFETGSLSPGWNWDCWCGSPGGAWIVTKKKTTPSGFSWFGPLQGSFSALADEESADTLYLWQKFKIGKPNARLTLIADWNSRSVNGSVQPGSGLRTTPLCAVPGSTSSSGSTSWPRARGPFTTDPGDILKTIFSDRSTTHH